MGSQNTFSWPCRIYYEDTDVSGVVYHANYLRYYERCRTEWLRAIGYSQQRLMDDVGIAFTIAAIDVRYQVPARLDDALEVQLEIVHVGRASLRFAQRIIRRPGEELLSTAAVKIAIVDMQRFRPCAVPENILEAIRRVC